MVEIPPRGRKSPTTLGPDGLQALTTSSRTWLTMFLLEDAEVAVGEEVLLEGLELEAGLAGHVADGDSAEVG